MSEALDKGELKRTAERLERGIATPIPKDPLGMFKMVITLLEDVRKEQISIKEQIKTLKMHLAQSNLNTVKGGQ